MTLHEVEVWRITWISEDDGTQSGGPFFFTKEDAENYSVTHGIDQKVVPVTVLCSDCGSRWYRAQLTEIAIDEHIHRESAMKKLTNLERKALGIE